jgi:hypothetical protein
MEHFSDEEVMEAKQGKVTSASQSISKSKQGDVAAAKTGHASKMKPGKDRASSDEAISANSGEAKRKS